MPAVPGKTNYVTGIEFTPGNATAVAYVIATLVNILGTTLTFIVQVAGTGAVGSSNNQYSFNPPLPASAINTAVTLTMPALGAGNADASVNIHGYYM